MRMLTYMSVIVRVRLCVSNHLSVSICMFAVTARKVEDDLHSSLTATNRPEELTMSRPLRPVGNIFWLPVIA